ncbi:MAG: Holliday junction branch migration protein RuvA [Chloroflexota bacterium]|nr:Holliday junction branch migration protein RuvA [Chloroflexota bacterium]
MVSSIISSITGQLDATGIDWADLNIGNITLRINVPGSTLEKLGELGKQTKIHTSLQVREDSLDLFGFATIEECSTFELLITINGVGPRLALAILSTLNPSTISAAVETGDTSVLSSVSGVGKKTAERIILELKGKIVSNITTDLSPDGYDEVLEALTALGYKTHEARKAIQDTDEMTDLPIEEKVRRVLEKMASA